MVISPSAIEISDDEIARVVALGDELTHSLPNVEPEAVKRSVGRAWASFRNARVRDFVPLLVRRQVVDELTHPRPV
jgi:hypothetical protein